MSAPAPAQLVDAPGMPRTTATLLASLAGRLAALRLVSGSTAAGSVIAGVAALGREVSRTAEGAKLRAALEKGRPGINGNAIWSSLHIDEWAADLPPSPVFFQLQNDLALIGADDLDEILALPLPPLTSSQGTPENTAPATFLDYTLGLWALARATVGGIEALAEPTRSPSGDVAAPVEVEPGLDGGPLLR